jgi:putative flavoprotein involved in K+ transport
MKVTVAIIGAGHAGLSMSQRLTARGIDHVVLERGQVANSWRTERWDSLRLLTPNWQTRLPGASYAGDDPDGYMSSGELADAVDAYGRAIDAPVTTDTTVTRLARTDGGYVVETSRSTWRARSVVIASGASNLASIPLAAALVPRGVRSLHALDYRNPDQLDDRAVLVVGASATGVQLADEIQRSGRMVTLSVGEHVRVPRTYRGRDVFWWLERAGVLGQSTGDVDDIARARRVPSPQLVGSASHASLDLNTLRAGGVRIVGRMAHIADGRAQFAGSLANVCALADLKLGRLLDVFDDWAVQAALDGDLDGPHRYEPTRVDPRSPLELDLASGEFGTVIWATGYRPDYSWLDLPLLDRRGRIRHDDGVVTDAPGCYVLGLNFLRRRGSSYISGAVGDTADLADHLRRHLDRESAAPRADYSSSKLLRKARVRSASSGVPGASRIASSVAPASMNR